MLERLERKEYENMKISIERMKVSKIAFALNGVKKRKEIENSRIP